MNDPDDIFDAESPGPLGRGDSSSARELEPAASPCIGVCSLDAAGVQCIACHRTMDEIQRWGAMSNAERRAVLDRTRP